MIEIGNLLRGCSQSGFDGGNHHFGNVHSFLARNMMWKAGKDESCKMSRDSGAPHRNSRPGNLVQCHICSFHFHERLGSFYCTF